MSQFPITVQIPINIPDLSVTFWLRNFSIDTLAKSYKMTYPYAALYLQKVTSYKQRMSMDPTSAKALAFAITEYNLYDVQEMFRDAANWFTPENLDVLYGKNDNGMLVFNNEYNKLNAMYVSEFANVRTAIKIAPTVIEVGQEKYEPGVIMYINKQENYTLLKKSTFLRFCDFIEKFNFQTYMSFILTCFQYCLSTNSIFSQEEVQKRYNMMRQYNTNLQ